MYTGLDLASKVTPEQIAPAKARHPQSERSVVALDLLRKRERDAARRTRRLFLSGVALLLGVPPIVLGALWRLAPHIAPPSKPEPVQLVYIGLALTVIASALALSVHKESRADLVQQYIDSGSHSSGTTGNPLVRWLLVLLMIGSTYGALICIDAAKTAWLRLRLRRVDRYRAASVLALLQSTPAGVDPRRLLLHGENSLAFRRTLAYLVIHDWANISPRGDHLVALSPARRHLRDGWMI